MRLVQVVSESNIQHARKLFEEYAAGLGFSLCFQNFDLELAKLPGDYAAPHGRLLLAELDGEVAGCVALRKLDDLTCEMKRLFLRSEFRGKRIGKSLVQAIIGEAKAIGYQKMRLDTIPGKMDDAISLYRNIGFKEVGAYYNNPTPGTLYMELDLAGVGLEHV